MPVILALGKQRQEDRWVFLVTNFAEEVRSWFSERLSKNKVKSKVEDTQCLHVVFAHAHTHTHNITKVIFYANWESCNISKCCISIK